MKIQTDTLPQKCGECGQEHKVLLKFDRGLLVCRACLGSAHYLIEEAERAQVP